MAISMIDNKGVPWPLVKKDYMFGFKRTNGKTKYSTLADLAQKYDVKLATLRTRAHHEGWKDERDKYLSEVFQAAYQHKEKQLKSQIIDFDKRVFDISDKATLALKEKLYIDEEYEDDMGDTQTRRVLNYKVPTMEVRRVLEATKIAHDIRMNSMGEISTNIDEDSIDKLVDIIQQDRNNKVVNI